MNSYPDNCSMDLLSRKSAYIIWGPPIALVILASAVVNGKPLASDIAAPLVTIGSLWMGAACFINGRRCSRMHCTIDGIAMPILGIVGILYILGVWNFPVSYITGAFWIVLLMSYIPEWLGIKYTRPTNNTVK